MGVEIDEDPREVICALAGGHQLRKISKSHTLGYWVACRCCGAEFEAVWASVGTCAELRWEPKRRTTKIPER